METRSKAFKQQIEAAKAEVEAGVMLRREVARAAADAVDSPRDRMQFLATLTKR